MLHPLPLEISQRTTQGHVDAGQAVHVRTASVLRRQGHERAEDRDRARALGGAHLHEGEILQRTEADHRTLVQPPPPRDDAVKERRARGRDRALVADALQRVREVERPAARQKDRIFAPEHSQ